MTTEGFGEGIVEDSIFPVVQRPPEDVNVLRGDGEIEEERSYRVQAWDRFGEE